MCGFAGFVGSVDDREQVLVNMMNTIIHRGPDSEGKYVDEDAALGFRRLSIIDLSSLSADIHLPCFRVFLSRRSASL